MLKNIEINNDNIDSYLFLDYIKSNGFNEEDYKNILELFQPPKKSISQFINTKQFILITSIIKCDDFNEMNLKGACGYLNKDTIEIPKTLKNDLILFRNKTLSPQNKLLYDTPKKEDFDCIIGNGISKDLKKLKYYNIKQFIGYCIDKSSKQSNILHEEYRKMFLLLNEIDSAYTYQLDKIDEKNKELCLIKKV